MLIYKERKPVISKTISLKNAYYMFPLAFISNQVQWPIGTDGERQSKESLLSLHFYYDDGGLLSKFSDTLFFC